MTKSNVSHSPRTASRQWQAAKHSSLTADWPSYTRPADVDIRFGLTQIRAKVRELSQNSDHAKGFFRIVVNNIVGATGFILQSRATRANGKSDPKIRAAFEAEWLKWGKRGNCEVSGKFSWKSLQRHIIETEARDGEAFIRVLGDYPNKWRFALQVIDPETVDMNFNGEYQGRIVRMGVELDDERKPVAYHLLGEAPISQSSYRIGTERFRVPASEIIHVFSPEFCWQTRGVPWLAVSAQRMHMIRGTEDAEVAASRASAAKFAAYEAQEWAPPPPVSGDGDDQIVDEAGNPISSDQGQFSQDTAPGMMEVVPYGYELKMLDPQHPNTAMPDFLKWGLRSIATGAGVSYNTLGNDAEGVNYTSLRFFLGIERDNWRQRQDDFEDDFPDPVRQAWTENQVMLGNLIARPGRTDELFKVHWQPRRWEGPDPVKQSKADTDNLEIGATTLTEIIARGGRDIDDVVEERIGELSRIRDAAKLAGFTLAEVLPFLAPKTPAPAQPQPEHDDDE